VSALDILAKLGGPGANCLTQLQRILVITDGTLTEILEAAALERIRLVKISQETVSSTTFDLHFTPAPGEVFLERNILLQGSKSNKNYVYAKSVIAVNRLPRSFDDELVHSDTPLGQLWLEHRLETFKELLETRFERAGELSKHFHCDASSTLLARTYRVSSGAMPVMVISESFPVG
jgi:chorismate-pyruvate lyase